MVDEKLNHLIIIMRVEKCVINVIDTRICKTIQNNLTFFFYVYYYNTYTFNFE